MYRETKKIFQYLQESCVFIKKKKQKSDMIKFNEIHSTFWCRGVRQI